MMRPWLVRILVDIGSPETDEVAAAIRHRLATWQGACVIAEPDRLIRVTATTDLVMQRDAQDIGEYLESAIRSVCRECRQEQAVVRLTAVEQLTRAPAS